MDTNITLHTKTTLLRVITAQALAEVLEDMDNGVIPRATKSFAELHSFVDANCYGGLCDGQWDGTAAQVFGTKGFFSDEGMSTVNDLQDAVDAFLKLSLKV